MRSYFGIKELYDATLKTTLPMKVGNREFEAGEPILFFDKVQIAMASEDTERTYAEGGKGNPYLIMWEDSKSITFTLTEGVMSKLGFAMLSNANVISKDLERTFVVAPMRQELVTNGAGEVTLFHEPDMDEPFFAYNIEGKEMIKLSNYSVSGKIVTFSLPENTNVSVVYYIRYMENFDTYNIGEKLLNGYLKFEGKIYFKDDETGLNKTSILEIPRARLQSSLDIRVGERVDPMVSTFTIIGFPPERGDKRSLICSLTLLDSDLDYDI